MTLQFLNDIVNDIFIDKKFDNNVIIASLICESACKLINRITYSCLLISSLTDSALRAHVLCWSLFWYAILCVLRLSKLAIILTKKRELVALL